MRNRSLISAILLFAVTLGTFSCGGHGDVSDSSSDGQTDSSAPEETKLSDTLEKRTTPELSSIFICPLSTTTNSRKSRPASG